MMYQRKPGIAFQLDGQQEIDLGCMNLSGHEIVDRIIDVRQKTADLMSTVTQKAVYPTDVKVSFNFVWDVGSDTRREMWVSYNGLRKVWVASFSDEESKTPFKPVKSKYNNYYASRRQFHTYNRKSTKDEGKMYQYIRDFVDNRIVP